MFYCSKNIKNADVAIILARMVKKVHVIISVQETRPSGVEVQYMATWIVAFDLIDLLNTWPNGNTSLYK